LGVELNTQTDLIFGIGQEGGSRLDIIHGNNGSILRVMFDFERAQSEMKIRIKPSIKIELGTLIKY